MPGSEPTRGSRPSPCGSPSPADIGSRATQGITTADVLAGAMGQDVSKRTHADASRVGAVLRRLGWVPSKHPESRDGARVRL